MKKFEKGKSKLLIFLLLLCMSAGCSKADTKKQKLQQTKKQKTQKTQQNKHWYRKSGKEKMMQMWKPYKK